MRYTISLLLATLATPALADVKVVTDISPVHSLVAQVMGDTGTPDLILPPGSDPHNFQLKPSQAGALQNADLVIWLGPEMTPWLTSALGALNGNALELLHVDGLQARQYAEGHDHEGHDHAGGEDDHGHAHHDHDHGHEGHDHSHDGLDPHAWLDPENATLWLDVIARELSQIDPGNAAAYAANAATAKDDIQQLDADLTAQLASVKDKPFVVFHDAYGYYADHYGLTVAGAISAGDASSPSARRLTEIRAEAGPATCIFPEVQHDPKLAEQMAQDAGVKLGPELDPEGSKLSPGPRLYGELMQGLADTLTDCLN